MLRNLILISTLLVPAWGWARAKPDAWVEVRSPHFTVISNAGEKQARRVAGQFERIRAVFRTAFPRLSAAATAPITVLAVKDAKSFRELEPEEWLGKGQLRRTGLFERGLEKNYVLMELDAGGDHPYSTVYHEYTHLLASPMAAWLPLWVDEGLAEFYENTDIRDKEVLLGEPSPGDIELLRENRLLPLPTLFTVNHSSPYYNEDHKGSIFYGESWALIHYLMTKDFKEQTHHMTDYLNLVSNNTDPTVAARRAFGDLNALQKSLEAYVRQSTFTSFKMRGATDVDDESFTSQKLSDVQAAAVRGDFLVHVGRYGDARPLLEDVLRRDPSNVSACESLGLLELRQGHSGEARKWFERAVKLDSKSYYANYYFAATAMQEGLDEENAPLVERSLRAAIAANPSFAPAYDRLAVLYAMRREHLDEAHMLELNAVTLDPGNFVYRLNTGNILMALDRPRDAGTVARGALNVAKSQGEIDAANSLLAHAQAMQAVEDNKAEFAREEAAPSHPASSAPSSEPIQGEPPPPVLRHRDEGPLRGPRHVAMGKIEDVRCSPPAALDLKVAAKGRTLSLHTSNYFQVTFTSANYTPHGVMKPCSDMEGMEARVVYVAGQDDSHPAQIVSIELSK